MESGLAQMEIEAALGAIAARTPSPGGGAAVALGGAVAAALGEMVATYAAGRKSNAAHRAAIEAHGQVLHDARGALLRLADEDARAYQALRDVMARQKGGEADAVAVGHAARDAAAVPVKMIEACEGVTSALEGLRAYAGALVSDLVASAALAGAAARGAAGHVQANAPLMEAAGHEGAAIVARAKVLTEDVERRADVLVGAGE